MSLDMIKAIMSLQESFKWKYSIVYLPSFHFHLHYFAHVINHVVKNCKHTLQVETNIVENMMGMRFNIQMPILHQCI